MPAKLLLPQAKIHRVEDSSLCANSWVELDWRKKDNFSVALAKKQLQIALNLAQEKKQLKIEVLLNSRAGELKNILEKAGYQSALSELKLQLSDFVKPELSDQSLVLSDLSPGKTALREILLEQVNFHHQLLPDYYQSATQIDWAAYLQQVKNDTKKKQGLTLSIKEDKKITALIVGEYLRQQANIWEVIVADGRRQTRLGTFLLSEYCSRLIKLGVKELTLETISTSYAKTWYEKLGFICIAESYFLSLK